MTKNVHYYESNDCIKKPTNIVNLILAFNILHDAKKPMFISRLSKKCHSRYATTCEIITSHPKIFKLTEISPNRKLVEINKDPIILEKITQILSNLRYLRDLPLFEEYPK
jgi:hypothetical protein